jgi:hypothetical protein
VRRRKVTYPAAKTATKRRGDSPPETQIQREGVVNIDLTAGGGRPGLAVKDRVRIRGTGLYGGEAAVIERLTGGPIPAAVVRTEGGQTRRVRTIDLEPIVGEG